jgi:hypothetical protein
MSNLKQGTDRPFEFRANENPTQPSAAKQPLFESALSIGYGRHAISLIKAEDRMNQEAARLEKTRNRHKPTYIS